MAIEMLAPPGLLLILGAPALIWLKGWARSAAALALPALTLAWIWALPLGNGATIHYLGLELMPLRVDALARLFATVFALMALIGGLFSLRQENRFEMPSAFAYAGGAVGVSLAGDLVTVFVFWETMAIFSTLVIWCAGTEASRRAGLRYAAIHFLGGAVLMAGIAGHVAQTGSVAFTVLGTGSLPHWLILAGFLLNAGAPPFAAWLPDAYPEASWSGTVFLSAFTTKTAVYVLLRGYPGSEILIYVGLYMIFYGIIYAILENDMRRILAYSIVNQVGFMVCGIGIGTELALNGAAAHAFAHIIYKALLLMSAGAVLYQTGKRKCTDLGGLWHSMPLTTALGIVGALSISAFPLTSGFVSKSMISDAAQNGHMVIIWLLLMAASAGVFLHAGIKFPWFVFFQEDSGLRPPEPPRSMRLAMLAAAAICLGLGVYPVPLYALLPYPVAFQAYSADHTVLQFQLLLFSGLAFFVMLPLLKRTLTITLDVDWFWRHFGGALGREFSGRLLGPIGYRLIQGWRRQAERFAAQLYRLHGPQGVLARAWPTGSMVLWVTVMLGGYLLLYLLG